MYTTIRVAVFLLSLAFFLPEGWSQSTARIATVIAMDGTQVTVTAKNATRVANSMVLYTPDWGYRTGTNAYGTEIILAQTSEVQHYTVSGINSVLINPSLSGNSAIPKKGLVLSGAPGTQAQILASHFKVGDMVTVNEPTTHTASFTATAINAVRGTNELIIYTPAFGVSTQTNAYGEELTVENGVVAQAGGNNSSIPSDGFVLSGHGTAAAWLSANATIGNQVTLNGLVVTITTSPASYVYQAAQTIRSTKASIQSGLQQFVIAPFGEAEALNAKAEKQLKQASGLESSNPAQSIFLAQEAMNTANAAYDDTLPSRVAEARGTWYRPVEKNLEQVRETLEHMKAGRFNELYLETWFEGYTIYPSAVLASAGIANQNPSFAGFDPLRAFATEGKKRGIAVHAWIDGFMVGTDPTGGPVLKAHPEWAAKTRNQVGNAKPTPDPSTGYFWIDIVNPQVRQFMLDLTKEMVQQYGLAGVNLDYTRFPSEADWHNSFDFSDYARQAYQAVSGIDPYTIDAATQSVAWSAWTAWQSDQEDLFVQDEYRTMKGISSQTVVSATPEPGAESAEIGKWSQYIDVVIPQAYSLGSVPPLVQQTEAQLTPGNLIYAGIYPFYHYENAATTVAEVLSGHDLISGTTIFAFGEATEPDIAALHQGVWRNHAISPGLHPIAATRAQLGALADDVLTVYVPRHAMDVKTAATFLSKVAQIDHALSLPDVNPDHAQQELADLANSFYSKAGEKEINPIVSDRLKGQLMYLENLLTYSVIKNIE